MDKRTVAIIVGGGLCSGLGAAIQGATREAERRGFRCITFRDVFTPALTEGKLEEIELDNVLVERWHDLQGLPRPLGSSKPRPMPRSDDELRYVDGQLAELGVTDEIWIGGNSSLDYARKFESLSARPRKWVAIARGIDDDLPLPDSAYALGYASARSAGARIINNLDVDASGSHQRYYLAVLPGRDSGRLAAGIARASNPAAIFIPEMYPKGITVEAFLKQVAGVIVKRWAYGQGSGVIIIQESVPDRLINLPKISLTASDQHDFTIGGGDDGDGNRFYSEKEDILYLSLLLSDLLRNELSLPMTIRRIVNSQELRTPPVDAADVEMGRMLGLAAVDRLAGGESRIMLYRQGDELAQKSLSELKQQDGHIQTRGVDVTSFAWRNYAEHLPYIRAEDLGNTEVLNRLADAVHLSPESFRSFFQEAVA